MSAFEHLRDAHLHLPEHGEQRTSVDLSTCTGIDGCLERVAACCADGNALREDWMVCEKARPSAWREERFPTSRELDAITRGRPLVVRSFDHHSASANTEALTRAGLLAADGAPAHPEVDPTGHVWEEGYARLIGAIPERSDAEERRCVLDAQSDLVSMGFVEVHDMFSTARLARTLLALEREGSLTMRVTLFAVPDHLDAVERALDGASSDLVRLGGLKLFVDGTLSGRTAHMLDEYIDGLLGQPHGTALWTDEALLERFREADRVGRGVACHAIGDGAVRRLLDLDDALATKLGRTPHHALRLEHAQFMHPDDVRRVADRVGEGRRIVVSPQPSHLLTDIEATRRYTPHAEGWAFPLRSLVESLRDVGADPAAHVELGSDTPVVRPDPADTLMGACARRRDGMDAAAALNIGDALDEETTLALYRSSASSA